MAKILAAVYVGYERTGEIVGVIERGKIEVCKRRIDGRVVWFSSFPELSPEAKALIDLSGDGPSVEIYHGREYTPGRLANASVYEREDPKFSRLYDVEIVPTSEVINSLDFESLEAHGAVEEAWREWELNGDESGLFTPGQEFGVFAHARSFVTQDEGDGSGVYHSFRLDFEGE